MADYEAIKISSLTPTETLIKDDFLVVDKLQPGTDYITSKATVGTVANFLASSDLNFTGNVTFSNTIQPPPSLTLDAVFDNLVIRESLTISDGATVSGLFLDYLEDVKIVSPQEGESLVYRIDPSGIGYFRNEVVLSDVVEEAPDDGRIYARQSEAWKDITDCIKCPDEVIDQIGNVLISIADGTDPNNIINDVPIAFSATIDGNVEDVTFSWSTVPNSVIIVTPFDTDEGRVVVQVDGLIRYIIGIIMTFINNNGIEIPYDYTVSSPSGDGKIKVETPYISLPIVNEIDTTRVSWSVSTNTASIFIRDVNDSVIKLDNLLSHIIRCIQEDGMITAEQGSYSATVDSQTNDLIVTKMLNTGVNVEIETDVDDNIALTNDWNLSPVTHTMTNRTTDQAVITFNEPINYFVTCTAESNTAVDSPSTGVFEVLIKDNYRLAMDPSGDYLLDEDGDFLIYDYPKSSMLST